MYHNNNKVMMNQDLRKKIRLNYKSKRKHTESFKYDF